MNAFATPSFRVCLLTLVLLSAASITLNGQNWGLTDGPFGGLIYDLLVLDQDTMLVADYRNGAWKTVDGGANWTIANSGLTSHAAETITRTKNGTLLLGTNAGMFRSTTAGDLWSASNDGLSSQNIGDLATSLDGGTVFAATRSGGACVSTDDGVTWSAANTGLSEPHLYCILMTAGGDLFVGGFGSGIFRSTDDGQNWSNVHPSGYVYSVGQANDGALFASIYNSGIYRSTDNGDSWTKSDNGIPAQGYGYGFVSRSGSEILHGCGNGYGPYRSTDGGVSWFPFTTGFGSSTVRGLFLLPNGDCCAATYGDGLLRLPAGSSTWQSMNRGMQGTWIKAIESIDGTTMLAAGVGGALARSTDAGAHWSSTPGLMQNYEIRDILSDGGTIYAGGSPNGIFRSTNGGQQWLAVNNGLSGLRVNCIASDGSGRLYCGEDSYGVFVSTDRGDSWSSASSGLNSLRIQGLTIDANGTIYAANDSGVATSTDQGGSWNDASNGLQKRMTYSVLAHQGTVLAGQVNIYRSVDGGSTWDMVTGIPSRKVSAIVADASGTFYATSDQSAVYSSTDDGVTWTSYGTGLPSKPLYSLAFDGNHRLYCGTDGAGVYRLPPLGGNAEVTIQTTPQGLSFSVDGTTYTGTRTFSWQPGSSHSIGTSSPQQAGSDTRYIWVNWSDGGAMTHDFVVQAGSTNLTANFRTEHRVQMIADGAGTVSPPTGWKTLGLAVQIMATPDGGQSFSGWEGTGTGSYTGTDNPATITVSGPIVQTAHFTGGGSTSEITVGSSPAGRTITIDGQAYGTAQLFNWVIGSTHTVNVASPQAGAPGMRYAFNSWSNGQPQSHTFITPAGAYALTAQFDTECNLLMASGVGGTSTPPSGWHPQGNSVEIRATPNSGYVFDRWEGAGPGSYSGKSNPVTITLNGGVTESAFFSPSTDVRDRSALPYDLTLYQNSPNPCATQTSVGFTLPRSQRVSLVVTDMLGREIVRPIDMQFLPAGAHQLVMDISTIRSGVYFYSLVTADGLRTGRMTVMK